MTALKRLYCRYYSLTFNPVMVIQYDQYQVQLLKYSNKLHYLLEVLRSKVQILNYNKVESYLEIHCYNLNHPYYQYHRSYL